MKIMTFLKSLLWRGTKEPFTLKESIFCDENLCGLMADCYLRELAFETCVNLIANAVSKCEFKTYRNGRPVRGREYYLFNIEPNDNQNSSQFIHKLLYKLFRENECLVIETGGGLLVADAYEIEENVTRPDMFVDVVVGDKTFRKRFSATEVLYFKLNATNINRLLACMTDAYARLVSIATAAQEDSGGIRGTLSFPTAAQGAPDFHDAANEFVNTHMRRFMTERNAVLPLYDGWKYEEVTNGGKYTSAKTTRDIRAMIDDTIQITAIAFGIPVSLLNGSVTGTDDALKQFMTLCIDPLCDMIQEEINRKRNGYNGFRAGNWTRIDTRSLLHVDLLTVSNAIDKLISSGAFCINDIRKLVGDDPMDEDWANEHMITKNYAPITEVTTPLTQERETTDNNTDKR